MIRTISDFIDIYKKGDDICEYKYDDDVIKDKKDGLNILEYMYSNLDVPVEPSIFFHIKSTEKDRERLLYIMLNRPDIYKCDIYNKFTNHGIAYINRKPFIDMSIHVHVLLQTIGYDPENIAEAVMFHWRRPSCRCFYQDMARLLLMVHKNNHDITNLGLTKNNLARIMVKSASTSYFNMLISYDVSYIQYNNPKVNKTIKCKAIASLKNSMTNIEYLKTLGKYKQHMILGFYRKELKDVLVDISKNVDVSKEMFVGSHNIPIYYALDLKHRKRIISNIYKRAGRPNLDNNESLMFLMRYRDQNQDMQSIKVYIPEVSFIYFYHDMWPKYDISSGVDRIKKIFDNAIYMYYLHITEIYVNMHHFDNLDKLTKMQDDLRKNKINDNIIMYYDVYEFIVRFMEYMDDILKEEEALKVISPDYKNKHNVLILYDICKYFEYFF